MLESNDEKYRPKHFSKNVDKDTSIHNTRMAKVTELMLKGAII